MIQFAELRGFRLLPDLLECWNTFLGVSCNGIPCFSRHSIIARSIKITSDQSLACYQKLYLDHIFYDIKYRFMISSFTQRGIPKRRCRARKLLIFNYIATMPLLYATCPHMVQAGVRTARAQCHRRSSYRGIAGGRKAYFETGATESFEILERASARIECLRHAGEHYLLCRITTIAHLNKLRILEMPDCAGYSPAGGLLGSLAFPWILAPG